MSKKKFRKKKSSEKKSSVKKNSVDNNYCCIKLTLSTSSSSSVVGIHSGGTNSAFLLRPLGIFDFHINNNKMSANSFSFSLFDIQIRIVCDLLKEGEADVAVAVAIAALLSPSLP